MQVRNIHKLCYLHLIFLILPAIAFPQTPKLDSLLSAEQTNQEQDTVRLKLLIDIATEYWNKDPDKCLNYCDKSVELAEKIGDKKRLANALMKSGKANYVLSNRDKSLARFVSALQIYQSFDQCKKEVAILHNYIGIIYCEIGNMAASIDESQKSIAMFSALGDSSSMSSAFFTMGMAYTYLGDYSNALTADLQALYLNQKFGTKSSITNNYMNIGIIFMYLYDDIKAREYFVKAIEGYRELGDVVGMSSVYENLANTYQSEDKLKAAEYHIAAMEGFLEVKDFPHYANCLIGLAYLLNTSCDRDIYTFKQKGIFEKLGKNTENKHTLALELVNRAGYICQAYKVNDIYVYFLVTKGMTFQALQQYDSALYYMKQSLFLSDSLHYLDQKKDALKSISSLYETMGRYDSAYVYYKKYIEVRDSVINTEKQVEMSRKEIQYEFNLKEKEFNYQKQLHEAETRNVRAMLQEQLFRTKAREQELQLKSKALELSNKEKDLTHLAYLKKMAELKLVKTEKQNREKQLVLSQKENSLQNLKLRNRSLQSNLLIVGFLLSMLSLLFIIRNYRNQRKSNAKLKLLNDDLSITLTDLEKTQQQLIITEKQKETETIRRRISQDIHDDISSGLTRIAWLSEMVREIAKQNKIMKLNATVRKIVDSSRETIERLDEIVWAINPDKDNLEGFFAYLRTYIMNYLEGKDYKIKLDFPEEKLNIRFNPDQKRTLFLVVKEIIHNIVKHAEANAVEVSFHCENDNYSISINDNGKGFDTNHFKEHGNGLKNMQKRMESVGGVFSIKSEPVKGTQILLEGKIYA